MEKGDRVQVKSTGARGTIDIADRHHVHFDLGGHGYYKKEDLTLLTDIDAVKAGELISRNKEPAQMVIDVFNNHVILSFSNDFSTIFEPYTFKLLKTLGYQIFTPDPKPTWHDLTESEFIEAFKNKTEVWVWDDNINEAKKVIVWGFKIDGKIEYVCHLGHYEHASLTDPREL